MRAKLNLRTDRDTPVILLDSESYEDAVRNAVSLGGDADTLGAITGGIAEAFCGGIPDSVRAEVEERLAPDLREIVERFYESKGPKF